MDLGNAGIQGGSTVADGQPARRVFGCLLPAGLRIESFELTVKLDRVICVRFDVLVDQRQAQVIATRGEDQPGARTVRWVDGVPEPDFGPALADALDVDVRDLGDVAAFVDRVIEVAGVCYEAVGTKGVEDLRVKVVRALVGGGVVA